MKIAFISSEAVPYAKTGGLGDVAGVLPKVLEHLGCEVKLFIPKYSTIDEDKFDLRYNWDVGEVQIRINGVLRSVHLHQAKLPDSNVEVNFIDCPHYFNRGSIYTTHPDEDERFMLFSKGVIEILQRLNWQPDIIHCNDWQTGLIPLFIKDNYSWDEFFKDSSTVFTIHNIGYQGRFHRSSIYKAEIEEKYYYPGGPVEFENSFSFMKAAISFADVITTVSKTYAHEILTPQYGGGLNGALFTRKNDLYGILNGIDYSVWNPETDKHLPYKYSKDDLSGKLENKKFLLDHFKMKYDDKVPLIGIISRMVLQKGFDIVVEAALGLMDIKAQWIILGNGEDKYEDFFSFLSKSYPDRVSVYIGFNNELSHLIEGGADMFLMPSLYEPCGLNQLYSLKYGTVPIVRKTGGLADTVKDWDEFKYHGDESGTGFSFNDYSAYALMTTTQRAVNTFSNKEVWKKIQRNGMEQDFSWEVSAKEYIKLYETVMEKRYMSS